MIVFQTQTKDRSSAMQLETKFKSYKSKDAIQDIIASKQNELKK